MSLLLPQLPLIADILLRSALLTVVFTVIIYLLKLSPDFNTLLSARYHSIARLFSPGGRNNAAMVGLHIFHHIDGFDRPEDLSATLMLEEWHKKKNASITEPYSSVALSMRGIPFNTGKQKS